MSVSPSVVIHHDAEVLAQAVAARLITRLADIQATRGHASVVLTGGRLGIASLRAINESPARGAVEWGNLDIWWGDERFVPAGDPERNEVQAHEALLNHVPVDPARVHVMAPASGGETPESAAEGYAAELDAYQTGAPGSMTTPFDILMLGVGPDGHVASLFPEHPAHHTAGAVVAVHNSPKPPPLRISLSMKTIQSADEVWLVVAGDDKADAVQLALTGAGPLQIPAAGAKGRRATRWLLDRAAASKLPARPGPG